MPVRRRLFNLAAAVSLLVLILTALLERWGWLVLSTDGPTVLNEQMLVMDIAFDSPPQGGFDGVGPYATWRVSPGVYRADWSEWHRGRRYILLRSWPIYVLTGITPLAVALRATARRYRERRSRVRGSAGRCPSCGYDLRATPQEGGALLDRCPECGAVPVSAR